MLKKIYNENLQRLAEVYRYLNKCKELESEKRRNGLLELSKDLITETLRSMRFNAERSVEKVTTLKIIEKAKKLISKDIVYYNKYYIVMNRFCTELEKKLGVELTWHDKKKLRETLGYTGSMILASLDKKQERLFFKKVFKHQSAMLNIFYKYKYKPVGASSSEPTQPKKQPIKKKTRGLDIPLEDDNTLSYELSEESRKRIEYAVMITEDLIKKNDPYYNKDYIIQRVLWKEVSKVFKELSLGPFLNNTEKWQVRLKLGYYKTGPWDSFKIRGIQEKVRFKKNFETRGEKIDIINKYFGNKKT